MSFILNKKKSKTLKKKSSDLNKRIDEMDGEIATGVIKEDKKPPHY